MISNSGTPVGPLLVTVLSVSAPVSTRHVPHPPQSILQVVLLCLAGYILARQGVLDKKTRKVRPRLSFQEPNLMIDLASQSYQYRPLYPRPSFL
jgi:hypothetical protein